MPIPKNVELYNFIKKEADKVYQKSSAYKSGYIVRRYKELGGEYIDDNKPKNLDIWFSERWTDVGKQPYPVYRPTIRVNSKTPLLVSEIDKNNLKKQIKIKQIIKGNKNLKPFKKK
jgi:hypothetical protein